MSGVKIEVAREGYDIENSEAKDLPFSTDYFLPKIFKVQRSTSTTSSAHGLSFIPRTMFFREITSSPKKVGHVVAGLQNATVSSIDGTNINFQKMTNYSDFETTPYSTTTDSASIAMCMLDPLGTPTTEPEPVDTDNPVVRAGGTYGDSDYRQSIHTFYDTLKVFNSDILTLSVASWTPSAGDEYNVTTATYSHNLGYIPLFAPFVPYQISLPVYYQWYWAWHKKNSWTTATEYVIDDYVTDAFGTPTYKCIKMHTSSASTEPGVGASWATYWVSFTSASIPTTLDVNDLEDIKYTYGGASVFDDEVLEVYVTTTQLVVKLHRIYGGFGYNNFPARAISMNYTIFYNSLSEEFDLL
jgi:hypothetical protein